MLILKRRGGQRVRLRVGGVDIWVELHEVCPPNAARLTFAAPLDVQIMREELLPESEQYTAATARPATEGGSGHGAGE